MTSCFSSRWYAPRTTSPSGLGSCSRLQHLHRELHLDLLRENGEVGRRDKAPGLRGLARPRRDLPALVLGLQARCGTYLAATAQCLRGWEYELKGF